MKVVSSFLHWMMFGVRIVLAGFLATVLFVISAVHAPALLYNLQPLMERLVEWTAATIGLSQQSVIVMRQLNPEDGLVFGLFYIAAHIAIRVVWQLVCRLFRRRRR